MANSTNSATRTIDASAEAIYDLLTNPQRHVETDKSGMVVSLDQGERFKAVGDTFTMNMKNENGDYQTRNEVFALQENKVVGWKNTKNTTSGAEVGAKWLYELEPEGPDATRVKLTYDRSEIENEQVRSFSEQFNDDFLETGLDAVAAAVSGA